MPPTPSLPMAIPRVGSCSSAKRRAPKRTGRGSLSSGAQVSFWTECWLPSDSIASKVYITNVVNWRPPANREPSPEEASICLPFLHRHVELANPKVLVLLGAVPARHLMGIQGIMRSRGCWQTYRLRTSGREIPTMLTLHPAYLLRQPSAKRLAWNDFLSISNKCHNLGLAM